MKGFLGGGVDIYFVNPNESKIKSLKILPSSNAKIDLSKYQTPGISEKPIVGSTTESEIASIFYQYQQQISQEAFDKGLKKGDQDRKKLISMRTSALINNMNKVNYLAPKAQNAKIDSDTDDSGNKIVHQEIDYKSIDEFDFNSARENSRAYTYFVNKNLQNKLNNIISYHHDGTTLYDVFTPSYYSYITKGIFKPNLIDDSIDLNSTTTQQIYNHKLIGYQADDDSYLFTIAQNKDQRAAFAK